LLSVIYFSYRGFTIIIEDINITSMLLKESIIFKRLNDSVID